MAKKYRNDFGGKPSKVAESAIRVLEYLKKNSDKDHHAQLKDIAADEDAGQCFSTNGAKRNDLITGIAYAYNYGKKESDWRIRFKDAALLYGLDPREEDELETDEDEETAKERRPSIRELYFNHPFSFEEVGILIESLQMNQAVSEETVKRIESKITEHLASKYFDDYWKGVHKVYEPALIGREQINKNLEKIRTAIHDNNQIRFDFFSFNRRKEFVPVGQYQASPYYMVSDNGKYYMIGCPDYARKAYIWRIDLMSNIEILHGKLGKEADSFKCVPKRDVQGLPLDWSEEWQRAHLNMSYDEPVTVRLRVLEDDGEVPPYTFLLDWFGTDFLCIGDDEVEIKCSKFGIVNFCLQYSDRLEVLWPEDVRQEVIEKIKKLNKKYGIAEK